MVPAIKKYILKLIEYCDVPSERMRHLHQSTSRRVPARWVIVRSIVMPYGISDPDVLVAT